MAGKWKKTAVLAAVMAVFSSTAGLTKAYMTHSPAELMNLITPGSIKVELNESKWNPENGMQLVPGSEVEKNPTVTNTGKNPAWIFLKVQIPVKEIRTVDSLTRKKNPVSRTELFGFQADAAWELVGIREQESCKEYIFGFKRLVEPYQTTTALFEKVTLVNFLEGELDVAERLSIPVDTMAIQNGVCPEGAGLEELYQQYLKQEAAGGGTE